MQPVDARILPDRLGIGRGVAQGGFDGHHFGQRRLPLDVDGRMVYDGQYPPVFRHRSLQPGARRHGRRPDHAVAGQRLVLARPYLQHEVQLHQFDLPFLRRMVRQLQVDIQCQLHHRRSPGDGGQPGRRGLCRGTGLRHPRTLLPEPGDLVLACALRPDERPPALDGSLRTGLHHGHFDRHRRTAARYAATGLRPHRRGYRQGDRLPRNRQGELAVDGQQIAHHPLRGAGHQVARLPGGRRLGTEPMQPQSA